MAEARVISNSQQLEDGLAVSIGGEIDLIRSPQLRTELAEILDTGLERLVIDLTAVPFMDSSGVATLVEALQTQRRADRKLVLCGLQSKVRSIFEISRLDMVFTITEDLNTALEI